jgi:ATP-dependent DNA helicase RecQ
MDLHHRNEDRMSSTTTRRAPQHADARNAEHDDHRAEHHDHRADIERAAASIFGWDDLHTGQLEAMEAVVGGRDTLAVMPTGYGKSAVYQVAGAVLDGVTVVVSPLIALQADQVAGLVGHPEAPEAVAINSGHTDAENDAGWERIAAGAATYVFLAPEQLAKDDTVERLHDAGVALFVVDEAHCVSSWGHDFRPDYLHLAAVVERLGRPPVLALTATGSGPIRDEIVERLDLRDPLVLSRGFDRPNLSLAVVRHEDEAGKTAAVVEQVAESTTPGIVYVATRKATERYVEALSERCPGRTVVAYHGGLRSGERGDLHERFHDGEVDVVVATSAFGMGIDKPDVRFVIHADVPESIDEYYQEIGRAGRDGEPAQATLHYRPEDLGLRTFFAAGLPGRADLRNVFIALRAAGGSVRRSAVAEQMSLGARTVSRLLDLLMEAGAVTEDREGVAVRPDWEPARAADAARDVAEARERVEQSRIAMMRTFAEGTGCRRRFVLGYFGEDAPEHCGNCDRCRAEDAAAGAPQPDTEHDEPFASGSKVEHKVWGAGEVMSSDDDRVTVFFADDGYKVLSLGDVVDHDLLTKR